MDDEHDHNGANVEDPSANPSSFLAPSDFLPRIPASTMTPSALSASTPASSDIATTTSNEDAQSRLPVSGKPLVDVQGKTLNPRSCVTCRRRKVKCDKTNPCSNCSRARIECVFPGPGRAPRKARKLGEGRDKELLERLRKLESVVKGMGAELPDGMTVEDTPNRSGAAESNHASSNNGSGQSPANGAVGAIASATTGACDEEFRNKTKWVEEQQKGRYENRCGRLVVNEGKSRYINNSFWANLSNEVEDLKGILNQSSDDEEDYPHASPGPTHQSPNTHHAFIFGYSSHNTDLLTLHPLPGQIRQYWDIYKDRVDPLCKILHVPTIEITVLTAASHLANLSRGFECLLFAIYYGATTSLSAQDCLIKLGEEKPILLARYRVAVEQALARANFLTTEEIVVLQSFVVFLICLRRNSDARVIWTLTGLVVRIAQTIGIHRDGSHFGLSPFEVEMRRRLWWQVCILDTRASEDHGCDPTIVEQSFDTKMPLNINDEDLTPGMKEFPLERKTCTIMSFCLLRFEVANTFRRINYIPPGPPKSCGEYFQSVTLQDKERWITDCHKRLEDKYLKHCDMSNPLFWTTATVARLMMSKMWLMVYHPFQRQDGGASLSDEVKEKLFITSLENMEYSLLLESEARTKKWGWLFRTYIQWHALAFTLSELCHRTTGDQVERAWQAVDKTVEGRWGMHNPEETNIGHLWRPLKKLYRKAKDARMRGLQEQQLGHQHVADLSTRHYSPNANPMFGNPSRQHITRAPLSSAQLQRFHQGPMFGQAPLDKHELLLSTNVPGTHIEQTVGKPILTSPDRTLQTGTRYGNTAQNGDGNLPDDSFSALSTGRPVAGPQAQRQNMSFGQDRFSPDHLNTYSSVAIDHSTTIPNDGNASQAMTTANDTRIDSFDSLDNDLSIMDTSGDMNWENWDQLVRQFGMDVDSGSGARDVNGILDWNAPEHDANNQNARLGFGPGGGDLF